MILKLQYYSKKKFRAVYELSSHFDVKFQLIKLMLISIATISHVTFDQPNVPQMMRLVLSIFFISIKKSIESKHQSNNIKSHFHRHFYDQYENISSYIIFLNFETIIIIIYLIDIKKTLNNPNTLRTSCINT